MRELINLLREAEEQIAEPAAPAVETRYANRNETKALAANLAAQMPDYNFKVEKKATSPVIYIRIFGADRAAIASYFNGLGLDSLPIAPEQGAISGKYRSNILSYQTNDAAGSITYTLVVASSGKGADDETGVSVSIKEFTPTTLGLAGKQYTKTSLVSAARAAVAEKTKSRPELKAILDGLLDIAAAGGQGKLPPEVNANLSSRARDQLSVDFGEILAPIMYAKGEEAIEFPAEGNFPLVDVVVGGVNYSVKSLTGSGTSFRSIKDLMDNFEGTIKGDNTQEKLFALFKSYHPKAGGKNVDKLIKAAQFIEIPEFAAAVKTFGQFNDWNSLRDQMANKKYSPTPEGYKQFLTDAMAVFTAGSWGKPVGMPADGARYLGTKAAKEGAVEKAAGFPSFRVNPSKGAADIVTYSLGVGTLNAVTKGPDAQEYAQMMTNIVNQSSAHLGRLDITDNGGIVATTKPFADLRFNFQYHAPSHLPGNNLPGFLIVYGDDDEAPTANAVDAEDEVDQGPKMKLKAPGASMSADKITRPGREKRSTNKTVGRELR